MSPHMTGGDRMARLAGGALLLLALASCGREPQGPWQEAVGRPQPNAFVIEPLPPLAIPPALTLPPPQAPAA
jgi:hypothetical protein